MDNTFKQKSSWNKIDEKPFHYAFLREITDQYESGDISYGKMVKLLNEIAIKWHNKVDISKKETTQKQITMAQQTATDWLLENIQKVHKMDWDIVFIQAKQMEKEQIETAFKDGVYEGVLTDINYLNCDEDAEFYYNSRYK